MAEEWKVKKDAVYSFPNLKKKQDCLVADNSYRADRQGGSKSCKGQRLKGLLKKFARRKKPEDYLRHKEAFHKLKVTVIVCGKIRR